MEEEQQQTTEVTESTETVEEGTTGKTFTQNEVNALVESRLARAKKQMPSKEELEAFKLWRESQQTEVERLAQKESEYQSTLVEKENLKRENIVLRNGVNVEDADYVLYKVSKIEGEFEENLKSFLVDNPKFVTSNTVKNTGVINKPSPSTEDDGVFAILKRKHPDYLR